MSFEILKVHHLSFSYEKPNWLFDRKQKIKLFEDISFHINKGEALGLYGDSGCGKSTLARCLLQFEKPDSGEIYFEGEGIKQTQAFRKKVQIVFQDSASALNPAWLVHFLLEEPLKIHHPRLSTAERHVRILELLTTVGLASDIAMRLPSELSGGQRQRINLARALAVEPTLLVLDEPVSQLDVSIQTSILKLLIKLQEEKELSYLLISHDLRVLKMVCHRIVHMKDGALFNA